MAIAFYLIVIGVVLSLVVAFGLRRLVFDLDETDRRLHQPDARIVAYALPEGQDPAVLTAALERAGYVAVTEEQRGHTHLLVACPEESDRSVIRSVIEGVHTTSFDGVAIDVGHIRFDDER
jgi:hypothetical protein